MNGRLIPVMFGRGRISSSVACLGCLLMSRRRLTVETPAFGYGPSTEGCLAGLTCFPAGLHGVGFLAVQVSDVGRHLGVLVVALAQVIRGKCMVGSAAALAWSDSLPVDIALSDAF